MDLTPGSELLTTDEVLRLVSRGIPFFLYFCILLYIMSLRSLFTSQPVSVHILNFKLLLPMFTCSNPRFSLLPNNRQGGACLWARPGARTLHLSPPAMLTHDPD